MYRINGWLDPLAGARVQNALGAEYRRLFKAADSKKGSKKDPKNRPTTAQLYADAFEALVTRAGRGKALRTTLVVVADYDLVADQLADPRLADGTPLATDEFMRLALEAEILPALFDTEGQPLWLGRAYRDAQRGAAHRPGGARQGLCRLRYGEQLLPTPPRRLLGGRRPHRPSTNLCLLCGHCHHKEIHSKRGATITSEPGGQFTMQRPHHRRDDVSQPLRR